jgi:low affinity Fe/Cu permease
LHGSDIELGQNHPVAVWFCLPGDAKGYLDMAQREKVALQANTPKSGRETFRKIAHKTAETIGCAWSFTAAILMVVVWLVSGPVFHFSDTWQLVINTTTTIITFLVVFLIQNTQNRDAKAIHLKLDELIRAIKGARNQLLNLEALSDEELDRLQKEFEKIREVNAARREELAKHSSEREQALHPASTI